ncbi:TPA: hypothetical protein I3302_003553 [Enterobacter asburiae]|nr:hypothetical protein [Enterobacter asburiae]
MQYVDCEEFAGDASFAADVGFWLLSPGGGCACEGFPVTEMHDAWCKKEVWSYLKVMVVGEGLLGALRLALRVVACGNAFSLRSNRTLVEASHPSPLRKCMMPGAKRRFRVIWK